MSFATMIYDILQYNYIWFTLLTIILCSSSLIFSRTVIAFTIPYFILSLIGYILNYYALWYIMLIGLAMIVSSLISNKNVNIQRF